MWRSYGCRQTTAISVHCSVLLYLKNEYMLRRKANFFSCRQFLWELSVINAVFFKAIIHLVREIAGLFFQRRFKNISLLIDNTGCVASWVKSYSDANELERGHIWCTTLQTYMYVFLLNPVFRYVNYTSINVHIVILSEPKILKFEVLLWKLIASTWNSVWRDWYKWKMWCFEHENYLFSSLIYVSEFVQIHLKN